MAVLWGFAEVTPTKVTVMAEIAEKAEDIDVSRAQAAVEKAEQQLQDGRPALRSERRRNQPRKSPSPQEDRRTSQTDRTQLTSDFSQSQIFSKTKCRTGVASSHLARTRQAAVAFWLTAAPPPSPKGVSDSPSPVAAGSSDRGSLAIQLFTAAKLTCEFRSIGHINRRSLQGSCLRDPVTCQSVPFTLLYDKDDQIQLEMIHVEGEMRHEVESWAHRAMLRDCLERNVSSILARCRDA